MNIAIIYDCEYLCLEGSQRRYWCAAHDPDPVVAQIGAVKLGLDDDYPIIETFMEYVIPIDRYGERYALDPFFSNLTGITPADIDDKAISLFDALSRLNEFSEGAPLWSWGKDELNMVAISCYISGIEAPIPAVRFNNAVKLLLAAGMPIEHIARTPSNKLAEYYGVVHAPLSGHDARDDALSISYALQHLLRSGNLTAKSFS